MNGSIYPSFVGDSTILDQAFERIAKAIQGKAAQFLFGAGMSYSCTDSSGNTVPTGFGLLVELLNDFFPSTGENPPEKKRLEELANSFPFECIVEAIEGMPGLGREDLTTRLNEIFLKPDFSPSQAHDAFQSVCLSSGSPRLHSIFTTNYDMLLEKILGENLAKPITEKNAKDINKGIEEGKICVLHLHGLLGEEYKITEKDIFDKTFSVLTSEFHSALTMSDAFVFVGYSMNDPDFRDIYMNFRTEILNRKRMDRNTYVVFPADNEHHYKLGKDIWKSRGAIWIPLNAEAFFTRLNNVIESYLEMDIKKSTMKKHNYDDEPAFDKFVEDYANLFRISKDDALVFLNEMPKPSGGSA